MKMKCFLPSVRAPCPNVPTTHILLFQFDLLCGERVLLQVEFPRQLLVGSDGVDHGGVRGEGA